MAVAKAVERVVERVVDLEAVMAAERAVAVKAVAKAAVETEEAAWLKLQLSAEEWTAWEQRKEQLVEERQKIREQLKQKFEEFCERLGAGPGQTTSSLASAGRRALGTAY